MSTWDELSLAEKAEMIGVAVKRGYTNLSDIRDKYNEFAEGGNTDDDLVDWIIREEGFIGSPQDIGDGKMTIGSGLTAQKWHDQYKRNGNRWTIDDNRRAVKEEVANRRKWAERNIPNWDSLPSSSQKALLSYKYNYDFNRANSPKLFKALADSNLQEAARQMDATSSNAMFRKGLQGRRQREQEWFLRDVASPQMPDTFYQPAVSTQVYNPYVQEVESTRVLPIDEPDPNSYIRTREVSPQEQKRRKFQENVEAYQRFNALMNLIDLRNNPAPSYVPSHPLFELVNGFAEGGDTKKSNPPIRYNTTGGAGYVPDMSQIPSYIASKIRNKLYNNISPSEGYSNPFERISHFIKPGMNTRESVQEEEELYYGPRRFNHHPQINDELWATYLNIPDDKRRRYSTNYHLKNSKYRPLGEDGTFVALPLENIPANEHRQTSNYSNGAFVTPVKGLIDATRDLPFGRWYGSRVLGDYGMAQHSIARNVDAKGEYVAYKDTYDLNPWHGDNGIGKIPILSDMGDASFGIGKPVNIYDRIYLDDYYEVPKEYRGGIYLPEIIVTGKKHSVGGPLVEAAMNEFKEGGSIHIKPENRGKFTALKERTGHSASWFKEHGTPAQKKMATFELNSRHWKHGDGGNLFDGTTEDSQQMQIGLKVTNSWKPYTLDDILANAARIEQQKQAMEDRLNNVFTLSNDATSVASGRPQNRHLERKAIEGAKAHRAWEEEHPAATQWGNVLGAVPFAVAAYPLAATTGSGIAALGDAAAATSVGQGITNFLSPIATTSIAGATVPQWLDLGLTSGFGAHGIQTAINKEGISPMTALEVAPLGRLAKPVAKEVESFMRNYRYPLGKPQIPEGFLNLNSKVILTDEKINNTPFFTWGNDPRFKVSPFKETYKDLYNQLSAAKRYKESPEYANLVSEARKNSEALGFGDFPEDLFVAPNGKSVDIVFESRPKGQLGEYVPEKNAIFLDMAQAEGMEIPYHEGIHWQRVGNPSNIGPRFNKWWEARKSNQPDNIQRQLFDDFRNSEEYNRFVKRRNADNYIEHEVNESLYPFADDYLRAKGELQAHGLEAGRAVGIDPFTPYPGIVKGLEAIEKARKYDPYLKDVKSGGEENVERFWKILTGQLTPALIPIGLIGTKYNLNAK